ncbi:endonuclease/exonuclease/phosphatase family protein [Nonomuraea sp. NBC_01738]|uniref:endonuclease/exonuclease/phosphatase family protein n=1 Tax=Nonomuraea sp. NBC_01738 TaxID=2976003 RepID=UPI002E10FE47|nr:endonuclease/exonuclease/phosphatase family protein [Nonomuraea sp. NBC_01738]
MTHVDPLICLGTWNVREGVAPEGSPGDAILDDIERLLARHPVDILALQEVPFEDDHSAFAREAGRRAGLPYCLLHRLSPGMHRRGGSGLALLGRVPFTNAERHVLPNPGLTHGGMRTFDKGLLIADADLGFARVVVASAHMVPFRRFAREASDPEFTHIWERAAKEIGRRPIGRAFVAGDLNTTRRDLLGLPLSATHATGVDTILYGGQARMRSTGQFRNASDHPFCVAEFALA